MLLRVTVDITGLRCEIMVVGIEVKVVVVRQVLFHRGQVRSYS
jgi:hypothetical protein